MKPETYWRQHTVLPFLKKLKHTSYFPIQQVAIVGDADYILCQRGTFVWLELKAPKGKRSPMQIYKAKWVEETGGVAIEASPRNWNEVKELLLKLAQGESNDHDDV